MDRLHIDAAKLRQNMFQSALAAVFVMASFWLTMHVDQQLLVASLGASAFIATFPRAHFAKARNLVGGYACGAFWGVLLSLVKGYGLVDSSMGFVAVCCGLAVFLTALSMLMLNMEHPPAAALTLSITLSQEPIQLAAIALACVVGLWLCRVALFSATGDTDT